MEQVWVYSIDYYRAIMLADSFNVLTDINHALKEKNRIKKATWSKLHP